MALVFVGVWGLGLGGLVGQGAVLLIAGLLASWALLVGAEGRSPEALGYYLAPSAVRDSALGLALGAGVALLVVALMAAAGAVTWSTDRGTVTGLVTTGARTLAVLALPAAAEETLFRGYPLQVLAGAWGPGRALLVTSVAFGLLHLGNPGLSGLALVNLMIAGAFLGVIYLKTGSLWWSTGAHLGWNWAHGFLADLPVSGLDLVNTPLWTGSTRGPSWLGGGAFGPEGSVATTVVVALAAAVLWRARWLRPSAAARAAHPLTPLPPATAEAGGAPPDGGGPGPGGFVDGERGTE